MSATRFTCFGGDCEVRAGGADAAAAVAAARRRMLAWHDRFSRFRAGSELSRLNADPRAVVPASPELVALAAAVAAAGERTGGLVDGTLAREIAAAGYRTTIGAPVPLALALRLAPRRAPAGPAPEARWRTVGAAGGAVLRPPGVALDSGGLAKGLFADLVADGLAGRPGVVVACAGDLRLAGDRAAARPRREPVLRRRAAHVPRAARRRRHERDQPPQLARRARAPRPPPARPGDRTARLHGRRPGHGARSDRAGGGDARQGGRADRARRRGRAGCPTAA